MTRGILHRFVSWLQRLLSNEKFDEVREFVYLDEISVRSLLASTGEGGIRSETVSEDVRTKRVGSKGSASIPTGSGSIGLGGSREREVQESIGHTRNYNLIQSKFTRLYKSDLVEKKISLNKSSNENSFELSTDDLRRGDVIELQVSISADLLFRLYTVIEYFSDVSGEEIDRETEEMMELFGVSLGNWIPVVGKSTNYCVKTSEEGDMKIVSKEVVEDTDNGDLKELEVVTLLNIDSLWVDPIQTLFNNDEFIIYCRVEDVDIDTWYPLKLTRGIENLSQTAARDFNQQLQEGLEEVRTQISNMEGISDWSEDSSAQWTPILEEYTAQLEKTHNMDISENDQDQLISDTMKKVDISYEESQSARQKTILNKYTDLVIEKFGSVVPLDGDAATALLP